MNKLQFPERLTMILIVFISIISCKKESDGNKLEDADIRILKVQRTSQLPKNFEGGLNPFFDILGLVEYEFDSNGLTNSVNFYCNIDKSFCHPSISKNKALEYKLTYEGNSALGFDIEISLYDAPITYFQHVTQVYKKVRILTRSGTITNVQSRVSHEIPLAPMVDDALIYTFEYPMLTLRNSYSLNGKLERGLGDDIPERPRIITREIISQGINGPLIYNEKSTSLHALDIGNWSIDENHVSEDIQFDIKYASVDGIPKKLVGLINAALGGYLKTGMEEVTSFTFEQFSQGYRTDMRTLEVDRADWMFLFAIAPYLSPMESDQIVSSISQKGTRFDIWTMQNTEVNKVETFPYTHDPVAKTLEIAGLKIWYEVVDK
jgi:hypothetical protein